MTAKRVRQQSVAVFLKILVFGFVLAVLASCQSISVMTYNVRLDVALDGENAWPHRKDFLVSQLLTHAPDIVGTQEGLPHQIAYIDKELPDYDYIGIGRDGGESGEFSAIFYKRDKFEVTHVNTFWLSPTPDERSVGWDAALPRICTYGLFTDRVSRTNLWVFNTHFDHIGIEARKQSARRILERIQDVNAAGHPVILMGDFNAEPQDDSILELSQHMLDAWNLSDTSDGTSEGTFNAFDPETPSTRRIDYVFISKAAGKWRGKYEIVRESRQARYPSDHFPVLVTLTLR